MRKLRNTREGRFLMEVMENIGDVVFNDIIEFDENGQWQKLKDGTPEYIEFHDTVKNGVEKAKELLKIKDLSLMSKIRNLYAKWDTLTNEELVILATLTEYKINLNYFGSECYFNWYDFTQGTDTRELPRKDFKYFGHRDGLGWVKYDYKTNPFDKI